MPIFDISGQEQLEADQQHAQDQILGGGVFGEAAQKRALENRVTQSDDARITAEAPEQTAEILDLGRKTGMASDQVRSDIDATREIAERNELQASDLATKSPALAAYAAESPDQMSLVRQDLDLLGTAEAIWTSLDTGVRQGTQQSELGRLGTLRRDSGRNPERTERIEFLERELSARPAGTGFTARWLFPGAKVVGQLASTFFHAKEEAVGGALFGATIGAVGAPVTASAGFVAGGLTGIVEDIFNIEGGLAYLELEKIRGSNGERLDEGAIRGASTFVGIANAALEFTGASLVLKPVAGTIRRIASDGVRQALAAPTKAAALRNFGKAYAGALAGEVTTEVFQEVTNIIAEEITAMQSEGEFDSIFSDPIKRGEQFDRLVNIANETFRAVALIGLAGPTANVTMDMRRAKEAKRVGQEFRDLGENIQKTTIFKTAAPELKKLLKQMGGIQTLYMNPVEWQRYWQSQDIDPAKMAEQVTGNSADYLEALELGMDMQIPSDLYGATLAPTEHNEALSREIRIVPDAMTEAEAEAFIAEQAEQSATGERDASSEIQDDIVGQLLQIGRSRAQAESEALVITQAFNAISSRLGIDAVELFNRFGINIAKELPAILTTRGDTIDAMDVLIDRLRAGEFPQQREIFGESLFDMIQRLGDLRPEEGGEVESIDLQRIIHNRRLLVRPEGRILLSDLAEAAHEAGFIPENDENILLDLLMEEAGGVPQFSVQNTDTTAQGVASAFEELENLMQRIGVDIFSTDLTNDQLKVLIDEKIKADDEFLLGGKTFFQRVKDGAGKVVGKEPKIARLFQQDESGKRGALTFILPETFGEKNNGKFTISLLEEANQSTFLHETGHLFLEIMGHLVETNEATPEFEADYNTLLEWFGVESRDQITDAHHEKMAQAFEQYLFTGKAPSSKLRVAFSKFRAWLIGLYGKFGLGINLKPEVREVFDRLLATDEEIAAEESQANVQPMFLTVEEAGMTENRFKSYKKDIAAASEQARIELQIQLLKELTDQETGWWKDEVQKLQQQVSDEINEDRTYRALFMLRRGTLPDGTALPESDAVFKLDRDALVEDYGKPNNRDANRGFAPNRLMNKLLAMGVYRLKGGVTHEHAAEALGFSSGDELVQAIANARDRESLIEAEALARMLEIHPDILTDGSIAEVAQQAVQNDKRADVIQAELKALRRKAREVAPFVAAERREQAGARREGRRRQRALAVSPQLQVAIAQAKIAQMPVSQVTPGRFLMAARRQARIAFQEAERGNFIEAAEAKAAELSQHRLYVAAKNTQKEIQAGLKFQQKFDRTAVRKKIGKTRGGYLEQIDTIRDRFDFSRLSARAQRNRQGLSEWIKGQEAIGNVVQLSEEVLRESQRKPYQNLTVEEFRGVINSLKNIDHLSRVKGKLMNEAEQRDLDEQSTLAGESIRKHGGKVKSTSKETRKTGRDTVRALASIFVAHRKFASLARSMDGQEDGGIMWELFVRGLNDAGDQQVEMTHDTSERLGALYDDYTLDELSDFAKMVHIPAIDESLSRTAILAVALNWGNLDSRKKLVDGTKRGNGKAWTEADVEVILDLLTEKDWKFVQGIWDLIDSFRPMIEAKEKLLTGVSPEWVEAAPINTKFGQIRGGYYPLSFDDRQSPQAHRQTVQEMAENMKRGTFSAITTARGHLKSRIEHVGIPVRLDLDVIDESLSQVIHDLTHHKYLYDATRLLNSDAISGAIVDHYGDLVFKEMRALLRDVAAGDLPALNGFDRGLNWIRAGTSIATMGFNVMTSVIQPLGLTQSIARIGAKWVGRGIQRWIGTPESMNDTVTWIHDVSPLMRNRGTTQIREISEIRNKVRRTSRRTRAFGVVEDNYFWLIAKAQMIADIPTWLGAYEKAMEEFNSDESKAIALADQAVIDSQGAGQMKDLAAIQRGNPALRLFTMFYSYFSATWNLTAEKVGGTDFKSPTDVGRLAVDLLILYSLPATLEFLLRGGLRGELGDDDEIWERWVRSQASFALSGLVGVRELSGAVLGFYGYEGPAGTRLFATAGDLLKQGLQGELDPALFKAGIQTGGILLHYPSGIINRAIDGFVALDEGRTENPLAPLTGPPRK